jgi:hypothetical protein
MRVPRLHLYSLLSSAVLVWCATTAQTLGGQSLEEALTAVCRITNGRSSGTGFLVAPPVNDAVPQQPQPPDSAKRCLLITAGHVMEESTEPRYELVLRSAAPDGTWKRIPISVPVRDGDKPLWKKHSELDVAVLPVDLPNEVTVTPLSFEQVADGEWVASGKLHVAQAVVIPCYPAQLEANEAGWPVVRHGTVASHPLAPVAKVRTMLIDFHTFGGDSGAPVLAQCDDAWYVVGLVSGMHRQSDKAVMPLQEVTFHTPLGLSIVVQAGLIRDTIKLLEP